MNFEQKPMQEEKIEKSKGDKQKTETDKTGSEKKESFHESEYKRYKELLEKTLGEFDLKTLNEAEKAIDEAISREIDLKKGRQERGEKEEEGTYKNNDLNDYQDMMGAVLDIKVLKGQSVKGLDIEKILDSIARNKYLSLNTLTDEKFSAVMSHFKGKNLERESGANFDHDIGDLIIQMREAVKNLAESKYSKLIEKQIEDRDKGRIEEIRNRVKEINVS